MKHILSVSNVYRHFEQHFFIYYLITNSATLITGLFGLKLSFIVILLFTRHAVE